MVEINNSSGSSARVDGNHSNGANTVLLDDSSVFPSTGTIVFRDSLSELQELTYTVNNTGGNLISGTSSSWTGTGRLLDSTYVYEMSYPAAGSTTFSEVKIV